MDLTFGKVGEYCFTKIAYIVDLEHLDFSTLGYSLGLQKQKATRQECHS